MSAAEAEDDDDAPKQDSAAPADRVHLLHLLMA
jgi:hypothetical protein